MDVTLDGYLQCVNYCLSVHRISCGNTLVCVKQSDERLNVQPTQMRTVKNKLTAAINQPQPVSKWVISKYMTLSITKDLCLDALTAQGICVFYVAKNKCKTYIFLMTVNGSTA